MTPRPLTHPLVLTERFVPAPLLCVWDLMRAGIWLAAPILFWRVCLQVVAWLPAYAEELLGVIILLDIVMAATVFLPRFKRALARPIGWIQAKDPEFWGAYPRQGSKDFE